MDSMLDTVGRAVNSITSFQLARSETLLGNPMGNPEKSTQQVPDGADVGIGLNVTQLRPCSPESRSSKLVADSQQHGAAPQTDTMVLPPPAGPPVPKRFLTRPQSSDGSIATGFTFERAKVPVLNMTRKVGPAISAPAAGMSDSSTTGHHEIHEGAPLEEGVSTCAEGPRTMDAVESSATINNTATLRSPIATKRVPSAEVSPQILKDSNNPACLGSPAVKVTERAMPQYIRAPGLPLVTHGSSINTTNREPTELIPTPPTRLIGSFSPPRTQRPIGQSKPSTPHRPRPPISAKSKVTKPRRKVSGPSTSNERVPLDISAASSIPSQEDLMGVLLSRCKHDKQIRDQERAVHATEVQDLKDISDLLWERLQEERSRGQRLEKEISDHQNRVPLWQAKIKKLGDFIQGLTNDHHGLRDKAKEINEEQAKLRGIKEELETNISETKQSVKDTAAQTKETIAQAKLGMQLVVSKCQSQDMKLQDNARSLEIEHERYRLNVMEMGKLTAKYDDLVQILTSQGNMQMEKLNKVYDHLSEARAKQHPDALAELKSIMHRCLDTVEGLRKDHLIKIEDLQPLSTAFAVSTDRIIGSIQSCQQDVKELDKQSQGSALGLREELQSMSAIVKSERSLDDQVAQLQLQKAALENRTQIAESTLDKSRSMLATAEAAKSQLQQQIVALDLEAANLRGQVETSPTTTELLLEIESHCKATKGQIEHLQEVMNSASVTVQERLENYADLQLRLEDAQSQLRQEQETASAQSREREASIKQIFEKHQEDKNHILVQAKFDRNAMDAKHRIEVSDLKYKLVVAEDKVAKEAETQDQLRADKQLSRLAILERETTLSQLRDDKGAADATAEERLELLKQAKSSEEAALNLATARLNKLQEAEAELDKGRTLILTHEASKSEAKARFEELETKFVRLQQSMTIVDAELEKKTTKVQDLEADNAALVLEAQQARNARRCAEARQAEEECKAMKAIKDLESYKAANPLSNHQSSQPHAQRGEDNSPPKTRRKAYRSGVHSDRPVVQSSQSQPGLKLSSARPTTPRRPSSIFDQQHVDEDELLEDLADLFPATPDFDSHVARPTVKFVADSLEISNLPVHSPSQSRDDLAPDSPDLQYITMSQVEGKASEADRAQSRGTSSPTKPTSTISQSLSRVVDTPAPQESQPSQTLGPPKSILKSGRSNKRNVETAGLAMTSGATRRRGLHSESQSLGPVIQDSQSQAGGHSHVRSRRASKPATSKLKVDKYSRRFSQELIKDPS